MGFYLVYVDEYGNSGDNLEDEKQPIFQYFAAVIPSHQWRAIETRMLQMLQAIKDALPAEVRSDFELHGSKFFSPKNRVLSGVDLDLRAKAAFLVAQVYVEAGAKFFSVYVVKEWLKQAIRTYSLISNFSEDDLKSLMTPNILAFSHLVSRLEQHFITTKASGIILIDEQEEFGYFNLLEAYGAMRSKGKLIGLVERPLAVNSRHHVLMQGTDVLAYLYGRYLSRRRKGLEIEKRHKKTVELVKQKTEEAPAVLLNGQGRVILSEAVQRSLAQLGGEVDVDVRAMSTSVELGILMAAIREGFSGRKKKG